MAVRFLLNGKLVDAGLTEPHVSLLSFLRERGLTGAKEGCAEGECGACAVALLEPPRDGAGTASVRAVNSCLLPVAACANRAVISVEGVAAPDGTLHPVQRALVERGGSQCGYCTPGFVMSMLCEFYRPGRTEAELEAISGNLCRCTGYRPIIEATRALPIARDDDDKLRLLVLPDRPVANPQLRPRSLGELWTARAAAPGAQLIAGGTDLMVEANQRFRRFAALVSLESVRELRDLEQSDRELCIGGAVTLSELAEHAHGLPLFDQLLPAFASRLIRNRATLGGNLVTASPIGDAAPVLLALSASLELVSPKGTRSLPLGAFFTGYRQTRLAADEVLARIRVPLPAPAIQRFYKVSKRKLDDISTVAAAFAVDIEGGVIARLCIAYGGIAATPLRAHAAEQLAVGRPFDDQTLRHLLAALETLGTPMSDLRGSARYRRAMIGGLLEKFWAEVSAERGPEPVQ